MREELRLRRARGEEIGAIPQRRPDALAALRSAREAEPAIPSLTIPADAVAAPGPPAAAVGEAPAAWDASLVGRRVMATFLDEDVDDVPQWYPATLVMYRPAATMYNYLLHFDDGWHSLVGLPDASVRLLSERVVRCTCARCMLASEDGELLGPGGRVFECPR